MPYAGVPTAATAASYTFKPEKKKRIRAKQEIDLLRDDADVLQRRLEMSQSTAAEKGAQVGGGEKPDSEAAGSPHASATFTTKGKTRKPKLHHVGADYCRAIASGILL